MMLVTTPRAGKYISGKSFGRRSVPAVRRAVRAARKQAVQDGEEHGALQRKIMVARTGEILDDGATAGLLPQPFEHLRRPDPPRRVRSNVTRRDGLDENRLVGEAGARA